MLWYHSLHVPQRHVLHRTATLPLWSSLQAHCRKNAYESCILSHAQSELSSVYVSVCALIHLRELQIRSLLEETKRKVQERLQQIPVVQRPGLQLSRALAHLIHVS